MLQAGVFREYDIRGVADRELLDEDIEALGRAIGTYLIRHSGKSICLGRDNRLSSPRIHAALSKGLKATGAKLLDAGIVPTPVLYYSAIYFKADGAVMITGGQHAAEYNGFKIVCGTGALSGDALQQIAKLMNVADFDSGEGTREEIDAVTPYVDEVTGQFQFGRSTKIVLDAGNGAAGPVLEQVIERLQLNATTLHFEMDGRFPNHLPEPGNKQNLKALQNEVRKEKAELGIAFDGDGDSLGVVDEKGETVAGDLLLLIYAREILARKPGATFIGDVKSSLVFYRKVKESGGNAVMFKTGHSLIRTKMKQERAELAGEMSGHMFFADRYYGYDDAIYAALRLLDIVSKSGDPLSAQLRDIPKLFSTPELRISCPDELKYRLVEKVAQLVGKHREVIDIDGIRITFEDGWALVRASNTEPALAMRFEASSKKLLDQYKAEIESIVDQAREQLAQPA